LIKPLTKAKTWYLDAIQYEAPRDRHFSIEQPSLSLLSYDADPPEVPVIALWNTAPGCGARVFSQYFGAADPNETPYHSRAPFRLEISSRLADRGDPVRLSNRE
jgi:hypothetical protein